MQFIGLEELSEMKDVHHFVTQATQTDAERRDGLTSAISSGLVRFLLTTELGSRIQVSVPFEEMNEAPDLQDDPQEDPWDYWVFRVSMDGDVEGDERETIQR